MTDPKAMTDEQLKNIMFVLQWDKDRDAVALFNLVCDELEQRGYLLDWDTGTWVRAS